MKLVSDVLSGIAVNMSDCADVAGREADEN